MKRAISLILALALMQVLCACTDNVIYESAEGTFSTQVDKKQILSERTPANNATVTLVNDEVTKFLENYGVGKGLAVADTRSEDLSASVPVTLSWTCDKENTGYTVIYTTKQDFSDAVKIDTEEPTVQLEDLFVATTYYWQVVTHTGDGDNYSTVFSFKTAETPRLIYMEGVDNARDVGGYLTADGKYRVVQGMLYRGARLNEIKDTGVAKALKTYKIKTDLDIRRPTDNGYSIATPLGETVEHINIAVIDYLGAYSYPDEMRDAIALCAQEEKYPIFVHCSAGRDRTGTIVFIIGALLGVPEETLCADYELTYLTRRSYARDDLTGHTSFLNFLEKFKTYEGTTLQEKAESYCKSIGVTDEQIQSIRSILLEEVK